MEPELLEEMLLSLDSKQKAIQETVNNLKVLVKNELRRINLDETNRNIASISSDSVSLRNYITNITTDISNLQSQSKDNHTSIVDNSSSIKNLEEIVENTNNNLNDLFSKLDTRLSTIESLPKPNIPKELKAGDNVSIVDNKINVTIPTTNLEPIYNSLRKVYNDIDYLKNETSTPKQIMSHWNDTNTSGQFVLPSNATFIGNITIKNVLHKSKINATTKVIVNGNAHNVRFGAGYADGTNFIWQSIDVIIPISCTNKVDIILPDDDYLDISKATYSIEGIAII